MTIGACWTRRPPTVCTFCVLATTEAAGFTKIPGEARFQLDIRSVQPASVDAMFAELHRLIAAIEARRGVRFDLGWRPAACQADDADLREALTQAAQASGVACRAMARRRP